MNLRLFVLLLPLFLFAACSGGGKSLDELHEEVMVVHDEAMLKMDAIYTAIADLRKLDAERGSGDSLLHEQIVGAIVDLQQADDAMMDWMRAYKRPAEDAPYGDGAAYLEAELQKIHAVGAQIDSSLNQALTLTTK